ncbi:Maleylacetate reductase [Sphingobium chlorophenolicum L-1]|uniref:Maleylacetate reductase n=2 Tax=Sphingobium chlorophenolicum TaxID=46429 RepID=F6F233_SPHCR|nr:maleylacetate reductase [Sphingobium chlorophenolicum]AAM96664.1 chloromaleylacetate reductase [Sphingobium chlorophenolicum L-1]AEG51599.1 Maleylacetate reductase [Sphingobium chlorophenolicum L-1]
MQFVYDPLPYRVIFGPGSVRQVADELPKIGNRALVLSTPEQIDSARHLANSLGEKAVGIFSQAVMHVPVATVDAAAAKAKELDVDCTVAIGGGSTIGLAKALSLRLDLPSLVVPTTYAGSEVTPIWGMTEGGIKTTGRDKKVLPKIVVYDPDLTLSLPAEMSIASGLNAIAHAMEGLYAFDGNPIVSLMAEESIRALARSLPRIKADPTDAKARGDALYGCWLAGSVLGAASVALHHKLCHTLGGAFDMPHAQTHTAVLPHAIAYNAPAAPEAMERASRALGGGDPALKLYELASGLGAEMSLAKLGMPADGVAKAAALAVANPYPNPRPITEEGIVQLLSRAVEGLPPVTI